MPHEAEEPILAPGPRAALFEWMTEIRLADDLAAAGLKPRRTALLYGPPGCGKTTWAHHFAARLGLPLACIRSESLIDRWLGATGSNIGQLFDAMSKTEGKVVVFFDEVDAIGGRRMNDQGASVERANSLNVLLRRIERFNGIALAATNRQDFLDPALWRRFDMQISIDLPGPDERFAIIRRYAAPYEPTDEDVDMLVTMTEGASPALLRALMEGMKRALVVGPRTGRSVDDPVSFFAPIIAATAPAPEYVPPPLWASPDAVMALGAMVWPMRRAS
ncbi:MAG TPA: ATP-binding protein [Pseudolabrys sp.]|nr:ATP-binding protein [Pseudolabrys sp.]